MADCYAVIVSRSGRFAALPYSIFGIYELVTEKKGINTATTLYHLYEEKHERSNFDIVLTEDSNSGYEMAQFSFENREVVTAGGNSHVTATLRSLGQPHDHVCVIVDGAAFGTVPNMAHGSSILICCVSALSRDECGVMMRQGEESVL